jgi:hypothetical protein
MSGIPFDFISDNIVLQLLSLVKIIKVKRLERVITYLQMDCEARSRIRIMYLIIRMVILCHWVACAFYKMTNDKWILLNDMLFMMSEEEKEEWMYEGKIKWDY